MRLRNDPKYFPTAVSSESESGAPPRIAAADRMRVPSSLGSSSTNDSHRKLGISRIKAFWCNLSMDCEFCSIDLDDLRWY